MQDFKKLPTVLTAEELIDKIFRRAARVEGRNPKEKALNKLATISNVSRDYFGKIIGAHPSYENLPDFYREMVDVVVGIRQLKKSLVALKWADGMIQKVVSRAVREVKGGKNPSAVVKSAYGRVASIIEQIDDELRFLNDAKNRMREIPILQDLPTIVVAGYPNVGKSSLVARISTVKPEVASYPFTTKKINLGFAEFAGKRVQIIDTPGLLDRPLSKRNRIERRAVLALKHLADIILFVIDPTETCGYSLEKQLSLLEEIKGYFAKPTVEVYSKADMHDRRDRQAYSAVTGEGIDELIKEIEKMVKIHSQTSTVIAPSGQTSTQEQHS
ncbi:NOG1 family protein [Archaeoglobus fulgidus]|uniref:GTP-binding protein, GTP1/OBG-family n=1 Tax=Archaeoglobus fulgidus (strain ATCC 49558 / DSM 4304 / JCM 9628 / NBRC 100126 / VC-16) TaxID=224325 RepID=O29821_ARCFU|nr:NOG1 family protein [Archaeoglobus fulgidus]AAB90809.1 GTP-binding protein, GTP1/OBG-family [Archaeoglobus fulgidus DSM 4304]